MIRISAFADEIAPDLDEQIASLSAEGIGAIDLRAAWGTPVGTRRGYISGRAAYRRSKVAT